jgi:hypothetical protein
VEVSEVHDTRLDAGPQRRRPADQSDDTLESSGGEQVPDGEAPDEARRTGEQDGAFTRAGGHG